MTNDVDKADGHPEILMVGPMTPQVMKDLGGSFRIHKLWLASDRAAFLAEVGPRVRAIATSGGSGASADLMDACPVLELISCYGVGVDAIDLDHARDRGIAVTNTPDVLNDDVADLAIALTLMATRRLALADRWVRSRRWLEGPMPLTRRFAGRRIGIVGFGRIGRAIAARLEPMRVDIRWNGPRPKPDAPYSYEPSLVELARWADVLILICPGGPETAGLVNRQVMEALGPEGTLVNVARGSVVDEPELVSALLDGRLGAAALDVFADEPNVPEALFGLDNVVLAPHIGSATEETRADMGRLVVDNLHAHFAGRPLLTRVV